MVELTRFPISCDECGAFERVDNVLLDVVLFFVLLFIFIVAVHVGQLLEPRAPRVQVIKVLLIVLCKKIKRMNEIV